MQTTNALYKAIALQKHYVEYKVEINGQTYTQADIYGTPEIASAVFDKFGVGNAPSSTLKLTIKPKGVIPQMALVEVYFRLKTWTLNSAWYPKGKYYIDTRKLNYDGYLSLECFDAMLKAEYTFMESGSWTETTALATVQMIASDMGVNIESNTIDILTDTPQNIPNVPVIGEDGTTGREMLCSIASMYGGNFVIDELGELKLIQLGSPATTININKLTSSLDTASAFDAIDRVILKLDEKTGFRSPESTFDTLTGRILEAYCPWTSQELADDLLSIVSGFVYQPYEANGATIDPSCQLGDGVTVNGVTSQIYSQVIHLDARCADDISAPYEEEVNHEYPYRSPAQRKIEEAVTQEELATAGRTVINGSNIKSGTITLGGADNGRGQMVLLDENDNEIGRWNKDEVTIYDDTVALTYTNAKLRVIRQGDDPTSQFGVFIGTGQLYESFFPGVYPRECTPYIRIEGTYDYSAGTPLEGGVSLYPANIGITDGNGNSVSIHATPDSSSPTATKASGTANISSITVNKWGRLVQMTVYFSNPTAAGDGEMMWNGTIGNATGLLPVAVVTGSSQYGHNTVGGRLYNDNGTLKLVMWAGSGGYWANWDGYISFTYMV